MRTEARGTWLVMKPGMASHSPVVATDMVKSSATEKQESLESKTSEFSLASSQQPISLTRLCCVIVLAVSGLAWDLWSKSSVFASIGYPGSYPIFQQPILGLNVRFQFETSFNHGALWGMGQGQTWLFATLSFVALGVILYFVRTGQATSTRWLTTVTGLLIAGTLGNLFDRLGLHGWKDSNGSQVFAVRDFLDFHFGSFHWATFNFADTYLVAGAIMLVIYSFLVPNEPSSHQTN